MNECDMVFYVLYYLSVVVDCWVLYNWLENECLEQGHSNKTDVHIFFKAMLPHCLCYTCDTVAFASMPYFAQLLSHLLFYSCVVQSHCFTVLSLPSFIDVCLVLFCSAPSSAPSFPSASCLGCLYLGPFVFLAVPVPPPPGVNIEEHIQIRQEEKRQRINRRHRLEEGRGMD